MQQPVSIRIIRSRRKTVAMQVVSADQVIIRAPMTMPNAAIQEFLRKNEGWLDRKLRQRRETAPENAAPFTQEELCALAEQAARVIPGRIAHFAPLVGVTYGRVTIRSQKTRWGSCSAKGDLNFNCLLMLCPPEVVDYVVVHELCHRLEMNHSPRFWAQVGRVLPDFAASRVWLRDRGQRLIERLPKKQRNPA